jgi:hypothetical protein
LTTSPKAGSSYFRLELPLPLQQAQELIGRILAEKPALDPFLTENGAEIVLEAGEDGRILGFRDGEDLFAFFKDMLQETQRQKDPSPGLRLS